jgi:hypothetical protein
MTAHRFDVMWGYFVELALTALSYYLIGLYYGIDAAVRLVNSTAFSWLVLVGIFWALSGQLFVIFIKSLTTEFGKWLSWRGAEGVFKTAFVFSMVVYSSAVVTLIIAGGTRGQRVGRVALALLILSTLNMWTLGKNVMELVRLRREFDRHATGGDGPNA